MPINQNYFVSVDLETGGLDPCKHEVLEIAGVAYDARSLEPVPAEAGGEFCSLMKPLDFSALQDQALQVNGITRERLLEAPDQKGVWQAFVRWLDQWCLKGATGKPILLGKNVRNFDMAFLDALNARYGPGKKLFNRHCIDLEDYLFAWHEDDPSLENLKMDTVRPYYGMGSEKAHTALYDARQAGEMVMRFLKLFRRLRKMKGKDGADFVRLKGSYLS
jgi:DNA polymerase III epsilon subunit-like protein